MLECCLKLYSWCDGLMRCGFLVCEWSGIVIWNFLLILQLVMLLWSYFSVVFTDPGSVPPNWKPMIDEERGEADPLVGTEFSNVLSDPNQRVRYCRKCNQLKPPRCHHCSVCEFCRTQKFLFCVLPR